MVGETGYIKLIDFGTVKETISSDGTTHTTIGTPHYMAPEVIRGDSYNRNVDYWSIGVCIYEFICGKTPFAPDVKDPVEIYKAVQNDKVTFPNFVKDKDFINLINSMLEKDVSKRKFGIEIKDMNWFSDFDFNSLYEMNTQVPTKPIMSDSEDKVSKSDYLSELKNLYNKYSKVKEKEKEKSILTDAQKQKGEEWLKNF
jgi:cGMP-dependent protein kinase